MMNARLYSLALVFANIILTSTRAAYPYPSPQLYFYEMCNNNDEEVEANILKMNFDSQVQIREWVANPSPFYDNSK